MQTFIPEPDFLASAIVLDRQRLGKQRVETLQILNALAGKSSGWVNHPATKMWRGYEKALVEYGMSVCQVWLMLGYKDTCADKIWNVSKSFQPTEDEIVMPPWWGDSAIHDSHKSKLLQKNPEYYEQFGWDVPLNLEYVWPV